MSGRRRPSHILAYDARGRAYLRAWRAWDEGRRSGEPELRDYLSRPSMRCDPPPPLRRGRSDHDLLDRAVALGELGAIHRAVALAILLGQTVLDVSRARTDTGRSPRTALPALALVAIVWGLAFAAVHVMWAAGSTFGLDGRRVTGVLLVIDIVAIPLCLLAAWVAWRLRDPAHARTAPTAVRRMAWAAGVILTLRGLGTIQALIAPPDDATLLTRLIDPFFLFGGLLFLVIAALARRAARPPRYG